MNVNDIQNLMDALLLFYSQLAEKPINTQKVGINTKNDK